LCHRKEWCICRSALKHTGLEVLPAWRLFRFTHVRISPPMKARMCSSCTRLDAIRPVLSGARLCAVGNGAKAHFWSLPSCSWDR
jgi:hypothetical protein